MNQSFDVLYSKASSGKLLVWKISAVGRPDSTADIVTEHGYLGGSIQTDRKTIYDGKRIGTIAETSPFEQAVLEARSAWNRKIDQGYVTDQNCIPDAADVTLFKPMLAQSYDKYAHYAKFPLYVQPKLDGLRNISRKNSDSVQMWSRNGKVTTVPNKISDELNAVMYEAESFDGELYVHGWTFQRIIRSAKKRCTDTDDLQYHIYDHPTRAVGFESRFVKTSLSERLSDSKRLIYVPTFLAKDPEELMYYEQMFVEQGYEGLMARNLNSQYSFGQRSSDLQKVKRFEDSEFSIVGGKEGTGREEGLVIFICHTEDGKEFEARPTGTREERSVIWDNLNDYIGKQLTVKFQGRSEDGIPRFPVGLRIREDADI